ncbi:MAG: hypothetical protein HY824_10115 [Acidobacteria bacterium]|nr:hypothetical protein [Acidobacteriota bacterium]
MNDTFHDPDRTAPRRPLRMVWVMQHAGFVRYFESVLRELAARGHRVDVAFETARDKLFERAAADAAVRGLENIRLMDLPAWSFTPAEAIVQACRQMRDSLRYHHAEYRRAPLLRNRADRFLPPVAGRVVATCIRPVPVARRALERACEAVERSTPPASGIQQLVSDCRPDVLLVSPAVNFESTQPEYLKAAARAGIRTAAAIPSWDNLTTKGRLGWLPDRVFVWNDAMRGEAQRYHDVPPDRIAVTGAPVFDPWFDWTPSCSREQFCRRVGLLPEHPFVLYLGSSAFLAPREADFADEWIRAIRTSDDPGIAGLGILVRPHPINVQPWNSADIENYGNVAVWPRRLQHPSEPEVRRDFFDSLFYCAAAVGVNTSAQIEAAILGKPVLALEMPALERSQRQVLHFDHLAAGPSPLLSVARSFPEHVTQLRRALDGDPALAGRSRRFIDSFVRPRGTDVSAAACVADELERLAGSPARPAYQLPRFAAVTRATALVPGVMVVWLYGTAGKPFWVVMLRAVLRIPLAAAMLVSAAADGLMTTLALPRTATRSMRRTGLRLAHEARASLVKGGKRGARVIRALNAEGGRLYERGQKRGRRVVRSVRRESAGIIRQTLHRQRKRVSQLRHRVRRALTGA